MNTLIKYDWGITVLKKLSDYSNCVCLVEGTMTMN